jgi:hypothetical protein
LIVFDRFELVCGENITCAQLQPRIGASLYLYGQSSRISEERLWEELFIRSERSPYMIVNEFQLGYYVYTASENISNDIINNHRGLRWHPNRFGIIKVPDTELPLIILKYPDIHYGELTPDI